MSAAVEPTQQEVEARSERAYELDQRIKAATRDGRQAMWDLAAALHEWDEENGWTALGYETLTDWLADPEIGMARSSFFRLVQSYRELVVRRQLPAGDLAEYDVTKVQIVLPKVKAGSVKLADALADVRDLGSRDLRTKYMRRPDPADLEEPDDGGLTAETQTYEPPPQNDGEDTPRWAADDKVDDEIIEAEVVEEENLPNIDTGATSGQDRLETVHVAVEPAQPEGPSAAEVVQWLDMALANPGVSPAFLKQGVKKARDFIVAVFPAAAE
jgi:hypothetical protein